MNYQAMILTLLPLIAMINLMLNKNHFLHLLLCLEVITLSMLMYLTMNMMMVNMNIPLISVIMLTLGACEASLGLSILVIMVRMYGNDLINNLSMNKC
uniref:NADH-ubiquinone oxidoreductase chain 4L n=1 Tax=Haementeria acuecueyetzin TaxID=1130134 RepID=A0A7D7PUF6_9ANNE|nr:NADH dehydrogenase subunit 4L [Haementeria acuecueyetzin]